MVQDKGHCPIIGDREVHNESLPIKSGFHNFYRKRPNHKIFFEVLDCVL